MQQMAAILISFLILHGLIGKMAGLRSLFSNKIHAGVLRQLTGIWDRVELIEKFGNHDADYYFTTSKTSILKARRLTRWIFGNMWAEIIIVAALLYLAMGNRFGSENVEISVIIIGLIYVITANILTFRQSKRSKAQFEEEVDLLRQKRIEKFERNRR